MNRVKTYIQNDDYTRYLDTLFFCLGIPNTILRKKHGFYYFEYELMLNRLQKEDIEYYINTLHQEEHLEIMQSTYTLSKIHKINRRQIGKLVITNPYTRGLKELMIAFQSESEKEKVSCFEKALENLIHIKYYYLEALYFYCRYLKDSNSEKYSQLLAKGLELSKKYYYQYIYHLFVNLRDGRNTAYEFSFDFYNEPALENYVSHHSEEWEKVFEKREFY